MEDRKFSVGVPRHNIGSVCGKPQRPKTADENETESRMWVDAQSDGRPAEYRWRPLFNAAKFG